MYFDLKKQKKSNIVIRHYKFNFQGKNLNNEYFIWNVLVDIKKILFMAFKNSDYIQNIYFRIYTKTHLQTHKKTSIMYTKAYIKKLKYVIDSL